MTLSHTSDITIVGAGPAGAALALALAQGGLKVTIIDAQDLNVSPTGRDGRGFALSLGTSRMLDILGVWSTLKNLASPINDIWVNDIKSRFFLHFDHQDVSPYPMGYLVESDPLKQALQDSLKNHPKIHLISGKRAVTYEETSAAITLHLEGGDKLTSKLLVAADGRASTLRALSQIKCHTIDYKQTAIVCRIAHELPHNQTAYELFHPSGPMALLPMAGNTSSLVWTEKPGVASLLMAMDEKTFADHLSARFPYLGSLNVASPRRAYPLKAHMSYTFTKGRLVLVGDAARSMHPVAGQGLNVGFKDCATLAELLLNHHRLGLDLGRPEVLSLYTQKRLYDSLGFLGTTDALVRLYSNTNPALHLFRNVGLGVVNTLPFLKNKLSRRAMGLSDPTPKLLLGERL